MCQKKGIKIAPSLICMDLCNLERGVNLLEAHGFNLLHIDMLDGSFSPSMPVGLDTIRQLRKKTGMAFDVHIMARENEFFINELIDIGVQRIAFHIETALHADRLLALIKKRGIKTGIALNPGTPVTGLEYVIEYCDYVLLMLINPGYAAFENEDQVPYAGRKIMDCHSFLLEKGFDLELEIDVRIGFDNIPDLITAGANTLVVGSSSLFSAQNTFENNYERLERVLEKVKI